MLRLFFNPLPHRLEEPIRGAGLDALPVRIGECTTPSDDLL